MTAKKTARPLTLTRGQVMAKAWAWRWANRYKTGFRPETYLTATDLHRRVRALLVELRDGEAEGHHGRDVYLAGAAPLRVSGFGLDDCRRWLLGQVAEGTLVCEHPAGKRTVTNLRFRPAVPGE